MVGKDKKNNQAVVQMRWKTNLQKISTSEIVFIITFIYALIVASILSAIFFLTATVSYIYERKISSNKPAPNPSQDEINQIKSRIDDISTQVNALSFKQGIGHPNGQ